MSVYVISDIHGCNTNFRLALKAVKLKKTDTLILLGDLIDRGNESKEVIDTVFLLEEHGFNIVSILGNHEEMLLNSLNDFTAQVNWLRNGGDKTLESFSTSEISRIPQEYIDYLRRMKTFHTLDKFILVHAGINMLDPNPFEDEKSLLWLRDWRKLYDKEWLGDRIVIHGHTPTTRGEIELQFKEKHNVLCIDNGAFMSREGYGTICILKLDDLSLKFVKNGGN